MNLPAVPSQAVSPTLLLSGNEARAYAEDLAKSDMLSSFFQGSVANVMFAMELGKSYNLEPAALLQNIHVFETWKDGKATLKASLSANLMVHLARHAGHIVTTKANPNKASCTIVRGDTIFAKMLRGNISGEELEHYSKILETLQAMDMDPKAYAVTESVWSMDKAHTAGLVKEKGNWAKYPHAMLAARAKADAVRMACEEVLITLNNRAEQIGGGFVTRDGQQISTSWTHLADELGGSINEDDGSYVPSGNQPNRRTNVITASAPAPQPAKSPARNHDLERQAIQAQAATDPSKAGWHQKAEDPKASGPADKAREFVESKPFEETFKLLNNTLNGDMDDDARAERARMILDPLAGLGDTANLMAVLSAVAEQREELVTQVLDSIADHAPASTVAEIVQEIAHADGAADVRLNQVMAIYKRLSEQDRLEDPAEFHHRTKQTDMNVSLKDAVRSLVQPLLPASA